MWWCLLGHLKGGGKGCREAFWWGSWKRTVTLMMPLRQRPRVKGKRALWICTFEFVFMHVCKPPVVTCVHGYISCFPSGKHEAWESGKRQLPAWQMAFDLVFEPPLHEIHVRAFESEAAADSQVCGVVGDVCRDTGKLQIGAVDHGAFAATFLRTHQILEALPAQAAAIVLLTCRGERGGRTERQWHSRNWKIGREGMWGGGGGWRRRQRSEEQR